MVRNSRSPSPSGSRAFRRHYGDENSNEKSGRNRSRMDYGRGENDRYQRDRSDRDRDRDRDYRNRDRERNRGYDRERGRDRKYENRPATSRRSASPPPARFSRQPSRRNSRSPPARLSRPRSRSHTIHDDNDDDDAEKRKKEEEKHKPNFGHSGLLAAETKTVKNQDGTSTVLKYHEPPEARKPLLGWRLYVFKGSEQVDLLHIHRQSAYLIGRDRAVAEISIDHPSCSKQHAVIQHRSVQEKDEFGGVKTKIKPFIIDLESTNGTHVNDKAIPTSRYYELMQNDVIKFGESTREYVLLHDEAS